MRPFYSNSWYVFKDNKIPEETNWTHVKSVHAHLLFYHQENNAESPQVPISISTPLSEIGTQFKSKTTKYAAEEPQESSDNATRKRRKLFVESSQSSAVDDDNDVNSNQSSSKNHHHFDMNDNEDDDDDYDDDNESEEEDNDDDDDSDNESSFSTPSGFYDAVEGKDSDATPPNHHDWDNICE